MNMNTKQITITGVVCLAVGLLLGFIPEYIAKSNVEQRAMDLTSQGETVQKSLHHTERQLRLNEFALNAAVVSADANSNNYADATKSASSLFTGLRSYVDNDRNDGASQQLQDVLAMRDATIAGLAKADPGVRPMINQIFLKLKSVSSQAQN